MLGGQAHQVACRGRVRGQPLGAREGQGVRGEGEGEAFTPGAVMSHV